MQFDFEIFSKRVEAFYKDIWPDAIGTFTLADMLSVFRYYFEKYEATAGRPHPPISDNWLRKIVEKMPFVDLYCGREWALPTDMTPEVYRALIDLHFKTKYTHNDGNIIFFFSGRIREMRYYEFEKGEI